jgi:hypothetical protein
MTEKFFKERMAEMSKYYTTTPNDEQYKAIWNTNRRYADEYFKKVVDKVILLYHPTNLNPFPGAHIFYDAHMDLESERNPTQKYVPINVSPEELPDEEFIKGFMAEVMGIISKKSHSECELQGRGA